MRTLLILGLATLGLLTNGCSMTPDIILRNSNGQEARRDGYMVETGWGRSQLLRKVQRECVEDYPRAGYERI
jgi:hypothetical protein